VIIEVHLGRCASTSDSAHPGGGYRRRQRKKGQTSILVVRKNLCKAPTTQNPACAARGCGDSEDQPTTS